MSRLPIIVLVLFLILSGSAVTAQKGFTDLSVGVDRGWAFGVGIPLYRHKYEEPNIMKETGWIWAPAVTGFVRRDASRINLDLEFELAQGRMTYDGAVQTQDGSTIPLKIKGIGDSFIELRFFGGPRVSLTPTMDFVPYSGVGVRWWTDHLDKHPAGYLRQSRYLYSPLGFHIRSSFENGSLFTVRFEYDIFWKGRQKSQLSDLNFGYPWAPEWVHYEDAINHQSEGNGVRGSVMWTSRPVNIGQIRLRFAVRGFVRYWHVADSDYQVIHITVQQGDPPEITEFDAQVYEPENNTVQFGLVLILRSL